MGLLHSLQAGEGVSALWELIDLAEEVGIPLPPPIIDTVKGLPNLLSAVQGGDLGPLVDLLGPAAGPLGEVLNNPVVKSLVKGDLEGVKDGLMGYLGNLDQMKNDLIGQVLDATGLRDELEQGMALVEQVRGALANAGGLVGDLMNGPITGPVLDLIRQASPEAAAVLGYIEGAASNLDAQLSGVVSKIAGLEGQLQDITSLSGLANRAIDELDAHLGGIDDLFGALGGLGA